MAAHGEQSFGDAEDENVIAEINIIPFVDIVLVLLIIFMVTSTAIVRSALKVDLPQAASAGESVEVTLNIVFSAERELFLDGEALALNALTPILTARVKESPDAQAVISADKAIPYGEVVSVIDRIKLAGVKTFALNIERVSGEVAQKEMEP